MACRIGFEPARAASRTSLLIAIVGTLVASLVLTRNTSPGGLVEVGAQLLLVLAFLALAWIDLRVALALVVLELVIGGVSGRWVVFPGGISGRVVLDATVVAVALVRLVQDYRRCGHLAMGRYGLHATALAIILPAIWMPMGLLNGNRLVDVVGDGNGFVAFSFAVVLGAAALRGDLSWLRRWVLICCVVDAALTLAIYLGAGYGLMSVADLRTALFRTFDMGGGIDVLANGTLRLYVGSGLFLQIGVVLVTWELIRRPRQIWPWLALALLLAALIATFTRGYWLGALVGVLIVLAAGHVSWRSTAEFAAGGAAVVLVAAVVTAALGWPMVESVVARAASAFTGTPFVPLDADPDRSNAIKLTQARVLLGHISERPVLGWGFGSIAHDYPHGDTYSYELYYLDRGYKTGIVGLLLFLSFPARLVRDSVRQLKGRLPPPPGLPSRQAAVPLAMLVSVLVAGATNPYLAGAAGIAALVLPMAWLNSFGSERVEASSDDEQGTTVTVTRPDAARAQAKLAEPPAAEATAMGAPTGVATPVVAKRPRAKGTVVTQSGAKRPGAKPPGAKPPGAKPSSEEQPSAKRPSRQPGRRRGKQP